MNKLLMSVALLASHLAAAQTNFPTLTTLDGRTYTNATVSRVTPVALIVLYPGGGASIPFTNLPPELQQQFGYDPETAASAMKQEAARAQLLRKQRAVIEAQAQAMGAPRVVSILSVEGGKARTSVGEIWLRPIPPETVRYFSDHQALLAQFSRVNAQIKQAEAIHRRAQAVTPTYAAVPPYYYPAVQWQMNRIALMEVEILEARERAQALSEQLQQHVRLYTTYCRVVAAPTTRKYGGLEIWKCYGLAPAEEASLPSEPELAQ